MSNDGAAVVRDGDDKDNDQVSEVCGGFGVLPAGVRVQQAGVVRGC
ncbi:MAG: hypothetical protein ACYTEQ_27990 [Planctomycetota bacterium]